MPYVNIKITEEGVPAGQKAMLGADEVSTDNWGAANTTTSPASTGCALGMGVEK